jgi:uncharacterized protein YutE (UPF0331/DUF86 family)
MRERLLGGPGVRYGPDVRYALGVISAATAARLRKANDIRNDLDHAYPPQSWHAVHDAANVVLAELDDFLRRFREWAVQSGILPPAG